MINGIFVRGLIIITAWLKRNYNFVSNSTNLLLTQPPYSIFLFVYLRFSIESQMKAVYHFIFVRLF